MIIPGFQSKRKGYAWWLADGYYHQGPLDQVIVHPRPDNETNTYARHRRAYPGLKYRVPISVKGGTPPHYFEIIEGPSGMTVGSWLTLNSDVLEPGDDYGVVSWDNPTTGTHTITVRVYDQLYQRGSNYQDVTWQLQVATSNAIFVDATNGNDSTGDGSIGSPFQTIDGWYKASETDATYAGYHVYYRAGTYAVDLFDVANASLVIGAEKPLVHLQYPGETATFDYSAARFITGNTTSECDDLFVEMNHKDTANQTYTNAHGWWISSKNHRLTFFDGDWSNLGRGTVGSDNPAGVFFSNPGTHRDYIVFSGGSTSGTNYAPLFDQYGNRNFVVEKIHVDGMKFAVGQSDMQALFMKGDNQDGSVRYITSGTGNTVRQGVVDLLSANQVAPQQDIEVCYCKLSTSEGNRALVTNWAGGTGVTGTKEFYLYRNTTHGFITGLDLPQTVYTDNNIAVSTNDPQIRLSATNCTWVNTDNVEAVPNDGVINTTTLALAGASRTTYLGTHGAEITPDYA